MKKSLLILACTVAAPAFAASCDSLASLALPDTTITSAQLVPAGQFTQPGAAGKGILDLRVAAEGVTGDGGDQAKETALQFPAIHLDSGARYTLHLNDQPGVRAGVVLRRLPVDLRPGLPVTVKAGQSLDIPITAPGDGLVTAIAEDGQALGFAIDHHGAPLTKWRNSGGRHVLTLANPAFADWQARRAQAFRYGPNC